MMKTHPPIVFTLYGVKTLEVGVSARVTYQSQPKQTNPVLPTVCIIIEDKLGLGYSQIQIITDIDNGEDLANSIRELGRAVIVVKGEGRDTEKAVLTTYVRRKDKDDLLGRIDYDKIGVITVSETQKIYGGFGIK
jgi:uncharacterized protein YebE (UPF0316 family)